MGTVDGTWGLYSSMPIICSKSQQDIPSSVDHAEGMAVEGKEVVMM